MEDHKDHNKEDRPTYLCQQLPKKILDVWWPEIISDERLWQRTCQMPVEQKIRQRHWRWIGHTRRKPFDSIARPALTRNPYGKRKRGRPRNTWRGDLEADVKKTEYAIHLEKVGEIGSVVG